jgi:hypothetical protein
MASRRQFLTTLGKALGTSGLLLPLAGKGALAIGEMGDIAAVPVAATPLPISPEGMRLRELRRALRARTQARAHVIHQGPDHLWRDLMQGEYKPLSRSVMERPAATWTHCVELAEMAWIDLAHRRLLNDIERSAPFRRPPAFEPTAAEALVEAVLTLGHGDRCYWGDLDGEARS